MTNKASFDLQTRADLFQKVTHDYTRIKSNWADSYAAFDFFVTALHLENWPPMEPSVPCSDSEEQMQLRNVCSYLANGLKHFHESRENKSVKSTELAGSAFDPHAFDANTFAVGHLVVHLEAEAAKALGSDSIDVLTLATKLVNYWESRLNTRFK